jgi:prepilin-type N-terminal cleavage/methylation domain-containing protein
MTTSTHIASTSGPRGFTLIETLVAISIIMIAIVVPFYGVQKALTASQVSRDQLIATGLAEEAVEYIYFIRHNNYLQYLDSGTYPDSNGWLSRLHACMVTTSANGCAVDPIDNTLATCASTGCSPLNLNSDNIYTQTAAGATPTRFVRTVHVERVNVNAARVTVTVTWITATRPYTLTTTETLYNWL